MDWTTYSRLEHTEDLTEPSAVSTLFGTRKPQKH